MLGQKPVLLCKYYMKEENSFASDLLALKGVGVKTLGHLKALGIHNLQDLLFHLPFRYQDRTAYSKISDLEIFSHALVKARVLATEIKFGKRRSLLVWLEDETGLLGLRYFHFSMQQKRNFNNDRELEVFGEVRPGPKSLEMVHPETAAVGKLKSDRLTPVYPIGKGLSQLGIRKIIAEGLKSGIDSLEELLPETILKDFQFNNLKDSLSIAHQPPVGMGIAALKAARKRLVFEEILAHHFAFKKIKKSRVRAESIKIKSDGVLGSKCLSLLPYKLTGAQTRVVNEIIQDLKAPGPMQRLLQGDVGSGKTIVALLAALECVEVGWQVAFMAPTEILAEQHFTTIKKLTKKLKIRSGLLVSAMGKQEREQELDAIKHGVTKIAVGTHALFQAEVKFKNLALVIVDEQHRFGVGQRMRLLQKSKSLKPHQLIMTATPIPRTLAMTFYSYLDYSLIDELPPGRKKIKTLSLPQARRFELIERIRKYCKDGKQVYWVCCLIDESEVLQCQAAIDVHKMLGENLQELRVGLVHGRLKRKEKDMVMQKFKTGALDILVATTVIEVGVDVPNASLMVIDNAERLGLSQLHQLRGRVGRGALESHCVLLYEAPLTAKAKARIDIMRETTDGFKIAERDLEIRGPGELLGTRQTGDIKFRITDLNEDKLLINKVLQNAGKIESNLTEAGINKLVMRWMGKLSNYSDV